MQKRAYAGARWVPVLGADRAAIVSAEDCQRVVPEAFLLIAPDHATNRIVERRQHPRKHAAIGVEMKVGLHIGGRCLDRVVDVLPRHVQEERLGWFVRLEDLQRTIGKDERRVCGRTTRRQCGTNIRSRAGGTG